MSVGFRYPVVAMTIHSRASFILLAGVVVVVGTGCTAMPGVRELIAPEPTVRAADTTWLLIENPKFPDVPSEPEYIWVEEDRVPTTMKSLVFGKSSLLAPPDKIAKYGKPPGGGRISAQQAGAFKVENTAAVAAVPSGARPDPAGGAGTRPAPRGYVVFVDASRVVIDLAAPDGVKVGTNVSVRRDKIAIVHPISGEPLGELDEEVAIGRVIEVRDKYSLVEIQKAIAGAQVQEKDRVVLR